MSDTPALSLDLRGLLCPLPVLRLRKALLAQPEGVLVEMIATDRASWIDVPHFCTHAGHVLESATDEGAVLRYLVRRGPQQNTQD
ncbi:tRNA 2-thiouridine synthesizing protein A [Rhodobacter aestuarii]|uniref:tRNA 2-thiouridine synthesizing protein A n=1 Tax=Rhodobacter aestuarii TaxID=453582 RepID=A0A1N7NV15_9RHOB|nr:sulfurtransferase TusA family protein [Rhodobacter aestuarii]PTV94536.1 tRNA 2-thiouridine synthesizing protein A [Rhodobacter aestuarii]SIT02132.1 tRNA 2-thiouridine synthesizing protein A [Rhodobacter aestuarii]